MRQSSQVQRAPSRCDPVSPGIGGSHLTRPRADVEWHADAAAVNALGGPDALAARLGCTSSTVRYRRLRGISRGWRAYLLATEPQAFRAGGLEA